jgi:hypothetical protein
MEPTSRPGWGARRSSSWRPGSRRRPCGPDPLLVIGYDEAAASSGTSATCQARSGRLRAAPACQPTGPATVIMSQRSAPHTRSRWEYTPRQSHHLGPSASGPKTRTPSPAPRRPASGRGWRATGRAPEPACKSDQQKSPISQALEPITHRPENDKEILTEEGLGLMLSLSVNAAAAAHRRPDQRTDCRV